MKIQLIEQQEKRAQALVVGKISRDQWPSDQDILIQTFGPDVYSQTVLLNLEQVEHIDSTGVEWLLKSHARCQESGGRMILHTISPLANDLFRMMRMDLVLEMAKDLQTALQITTADS